jgi:hypothetical protein
MTYHRKSFIFTFLMACHISSMPKTNVQTHKIISGVDSWRQKFFSKMEKGGGRTKLLKDAMSWNFNFLYL